jgi:hypothetical protein
MTLVPFFTSLLLFATLREWLAPWLLTLATFNMLRLAGWLVWKRRLLMALP